MNKRVNLEELTGSQRVDLKTIDRQPVSNEDFLRILSLLKENIEKNYISYIPLISLLLSYMPFGALLFLPHKILSFSFDYILIISLIFLVLSLILPKKNLMNAIFFGSANIEAAKLQSLIQTASQYREHAYKTLGDQVEFDLRLAEAEETLYRMKHPFQALFRQTPFDRARRR